jgi:hypothetical protein
MPYRSIKRWRLLSAIQSARGSHTVSWLKGKPSGVASEAVSVAIRKKGYVGKKGDGAMIGDARGKVQAGRRALVYDRKGMAKNPLRDAVVHCAG